MSEQWCVADWNGHVLSKVIGPFASEHEAVDYRELHRLYTADVSRLSETDSRPEFRPDYPKLQHP